MFPVPVPYKSKFRWKKAVGIRERYSGKGRKLKIYGAKLAPVQRREKKSEFLRYVSGLSTVEKQVPLKKAVGIRERYSGKGRKLKIYGAKLVPAQRREKKSGFLRYVSGASTVEKQVPMEKAVGIRERYSGKGRNLKTYGAKLVPVQRREMKSEFLRYVSGPSTVEKQVPLKKAVGIRERYSGKGRNLKTYGAKLVPAQRKDKKSNFVRCQFATSTAPKEEIRISTVRFWPQYRTKASSDGKSGRNSRKVQRKGKKLRNLRCQVGSGTARKEEIRISTVRFRPQYRTKASSAEKSGRNSRKVQRKRKKSEFLRYLSGPGTVQKQVPTKHAVLDLKSNHTIQESRFTNPTLHMNILNIVI